MKHSNLFLRSIFVGVLMFCTPVLASCRHTSAETLSVDVIALKAGSDTSAAVTTKYVNPDSVRFVNGPWQVDTISHQLILRRVHFLNQELFGANQYICVLEIPPQAAYDVAFTYTPRRTPTSLHAKRVGAVAAVNGSFFSMVNHHPICYLRIDGKRVGENTPGSDTLNRKYYQYGSMALRHGRPYFFIPDSNRHSEDQLADSNLMTAGPMLIYHGRPMPMRNDRTFVTDRHNRTAIAQRADGTVLLFTVDGRMRPSAGMSLSELITTLQWLGATDALNLDGGGSTTLYVDGWTNGGLVNHPTDNGRFDFAGERGVSNCVVVRPRK